MAIHRIVDVSDNSVIESEFTKKEKDDLAIMAAEFETQLAKNVELQKQKDGAKAKLSALGLTDDEIKAILGF
jgi:hypothetical protein